MAYILTRGMGDAAQAGQMVNVIGGSTSAIATGILSMLTQGGAHTILGITSAAVPVIGAGLMAATMVVQYLVKNSGCGQTCIVTSQWANQAGAALDQVIAAYFALPAPRTKAQQAVALANFDAIWAQLVQACGQPGTGDAGVRCITDRQAGACKWKALPPRWPGEPATGACWNWWNAYRDPIANDPVVPDTLASSVTSDLNSIFGGSGVSGSSLLPLALLAGLVWVGVNL